MLRAGSRAPVWFCHKLFGRQYLISILNIIDHKFYFVPFKDIIDFAVSHDHDCQFSDLSVMVKRYHSALAQRLGRNLAYYRKCANLTQEQLAEAVQVETMTISRYETGAALPSLVTLEALSMLLRVPIADLLTEEAFPQPEEGEHLWGMLESLSSDERSAVMNVLRTLTSFLRKQGPRPGKASKKGARDLDD